MKKAFQLKTYIVAMLSVFLFSSSVQTIRAQKVKKNTVRLKLQYFKVMDQNAYFEISAGARIDRKNTDVTDIDIEIYNVVNDENIPFGKVTTNHEGAAKFVIKENQPLLSDSTHVYTVKIMYKGNDEFKKASKSLSFKDADVNAKLVTIDSLKYIRATLVDKSSNLPLENQSLGVQVERLFMPLQIEEFNITDENGTILVPVEEGIPGIDGKLNIEVILSAHDDYGTVKSIVVAPIGTPIVDESTFDERTMWSPRNKTPIFLLIFPNLLIFGMWGLIFYLSANLYRISKS